MIFKILHSAGSTKSFGLVLKNKDWIGIIELGLALGGFKFQ